MFSPQAERILVRHSHSKESIKGTTSHQVGLTLYNKEYTCHAVNKEGRGCARPILISYMHITQDSFGLLVSLYFLLNR